MKFRVELIITPNRDDYQEYPDSELMRKEIKKVFRGIDELFTGPVEIKILRIDEMEE